MKHHLHLPAVFRARSKSPVEGDHQQNAADRSGAGLGALPPTSGPAAKPEPHVKPPKEHRVSKAGRALAPPSVRAATVLDSAVPVDASAPELQDKHKVRLTIHRLNIPGGIVLGHKLCWVLKLRNADGDVATKEQSTVHTVTGDRVEWDEIFEFSVSFVGQLLEIELRECDVILGSIIRSHVAATLAFGLHTEKLAQEPVSMQPFRLRSREGDTMEDGSVVLSLQCPESDDTFWSIFERHEIDLRQRAALEGFNEEQTQVAAFLQHMKPILQAYWVLLYVILRPIYWLIIDVRTVLTDWDDPGLTILYFVVAMYLWWIKCVGFGALAFMTYKAWRVAGSDPTIQEEHLDARSMLRGYQVARDALNYGRVDPLSYKLVAWELRLRRLGRALLRLETALQRGDRAPTLKLVGGLAAFTVAVVTLPLYAILTLALRSLFAIVLVKITFIVPINRRFPLLFKGIARRVKGFVYGVVMSVRTAIAVRRARITSTGKFDGDVGEKVTIEEWNKIGREIGTRVTRSRGERVGEQGVVGTSLFLMVSGEVVIVSESLGTEVSVGAPTTLLQANALIGHGRQVSDIVARKFCTFYEIKVSALRVYLQAHPTLARRFFASLAVKLAAEVRQLLLSWCQLLEEEANAQQQPAAQAEKNHDMASMLMRRFDITASVGPAPVEDELCTFEDVRCKVKGNPLGVMGTVAITATHIYFLSNDTKADEQWSMPIAALTRSTLRHGASMFGRPHESVLQLEFRNPASGDGDATHALGGASASISMSGMAAAKTITRGGTIKKKLRSRVHISAMVRLILAHSTRLHNYNSSQAMFNFFGPSLQGVEVTRGIEERAHHDIQRLSLLLTEPAVGTTVTSTLTSASVAPPKEATPLEHILYKRSVVITESDRQAVAQAAYTLDRTYSAGSVILEEGKFYDSVFVFLEGGAELRVSGMPMANVGRSVVLCDTTFFTGNPCAFDCVATSRVRIREFSRAYINAAAEHDPGSAARFYEFLAYSLCDKLAHVWSSMMVPRGGTDAPPTEMLTRIDAVVKQHDAAMSLRIMGALSFGDYAGKAVMGTQ